MSWTSEQFTDLFRTGETAPKAAAASRSVTATAVGEAGPRLSIVVPTRNEAANVEPLLARIGATLAGAEVEVIFVDDSNDETPAVIRAAAARTDLKVRLVERPPERRNGLGKAVVEGLRAATAEWVCVMDGDLQHPPETIPQLLEKAQSSGATLVAASRLREGGSTEGLSPRRKVISYALAGASRLLFPRRLNQVTDPLTGFFVVRRSMLNLDELQPEGFKILLEILVRTPALVVAEVPFVFGQRHGGESKASSTEVMRLARQMVKLSLVSRQRLLRFLAVGASGILVNSLLLILFTDVLKIHYLVSAVLATQGSTLWNFAGAEAWVFDDRERQGKLWVRAAGFFAVNNFLLLFRGPLLAWMVEGLGVYYVTANLVTIALLTLARYAVADRLIWGKAAKVKKHYYYNIHDIIRVRSVQQLPELKYFRTEAAIEPIDIDVAIAGNVKAHRTADSIFYRESLGRLGFSVVINQGEEQTSVVASPLVGFSPHVLYTNVVEPLLRWMFVRKGYALMHGASIAFGNAALFITARTDTGKTTTILRTIRGNVENARFLSDDMSIFSPSGEVRTFPKPLTISSHTLQAMGGSPLTWFENSCLQVQSRLHSRSGRKFAMLISMLHLPAATINAVVQILVPPPKYMMDRLVPGAQYLNSAQVAQIVVIERGEDYQAPLDESEKFATLIANAEDAYGFPPYPQLAHRLSSWHGQDLHVAEQQIVTSAVDGLPAMRMGSSKFDWHTRLPKLTADAALTPEHETAMPPHEWIMPEPWEGAGTAAASAD